MAKSNRSKFLFFMLSAFLLLLSAFCMLLTNSANVVKADYAPWCYVTIEAKLSGTNLPFVYDASLFTENFDDARLGKKWYVLSRNSDEQVLTAKKRVQTGSTYGILPHIFEGYDEVSWAISGTSTQITSETEFLPTVAEIQNGNQNVVLNASYHKYKINYKNCQDATNSNAQFHTIQNNVTVGAVSKVGYSFLGWTTDYEPTPTQSYTISKNTRSDVTLIANWRANTYQVKFNANGAMGSMSNQDFEYGVVNKLESYEIWLSNGTKNFVGWATSGDGQAIYCDQAKVSNLTSANNGIFNLYAIWTDQNVYQVRFNANGGVGYMNNQPFACESQVNLANNLFSKTGFTFVGWNTQSDGSGTNYQNQVAVKNLSQTNKEVVDLFAIWQEKTYVINFVANGGEGEMLSQEFRYTERKNLFKNVFTKQGLQFACWSTKSDGTGDAYADGQIVSRLAEDGEITLYAIWQQKPNAGLSQNAIFLIVFASVIAVGVVVTTILVKKKIN